MTTPDPFERAARREELEELQRQRRSEMIRTRYGSGGTGTMVRLFLLPYVVWGLLRAANHEWTAGPLASNIVEFFFGAIGFGIFTGFMLFTVWMWMMQGRKRA